VRYAHHNQAQTAKGSARLPHPGAQCPWHLALALVLAFLPALAQAAPEDTTARIRPIVDAHAKGGVRARLTAVRALREETLAAAEIGALWGFLAETPEQANLPMGKLNHLRNDVLNLLVYHTPVLPDLAERLIVMYRDQTQNRTWRDYCIQFLGQFYARASAASQADIRDLLREVATNHTVPTAGTALIALTDNLASPEIHREDIITAALAIAGNPKASAGARTTAFQICAKLRARAALPHVRQAASGETATSISVRMGATAALGTLGDPGEQADHELLAKLQRSGESRIRQAAAGALRRLDQRRATPPAR